jgi:hypothetical protein
MSLNATMRPVSADLEDQCANPSLQPSFVSQWKPESSRAGDLNAGIKPNHDSIVQVEPNVIYRLRFELPFFHMK